MATFSQKQIMDRSLRLATMTGGDPNSSPVIDNSVVIEDLFPIALRNAVIAGSQKEAEVGSLKRNHSIVITDGVGTLPDTVIDECLDDSNIYSASDTTITELSSFCPRLNDYYRPVHSQLAYYAVQGTSLLFRDVGGDINTYDGTIILNAISVPDIPATITTAITMSSETAERTIEMLAQMLRGGASA